MAFKIDRNALAGANVEVPDSISLAIAKGNLFVTTEPTLLEQVLRSGGQPLADSPEYQAVAKQLPESASTHAYARPEESARILYDMVKSGQLGKALQQGAKGGNAEDLKKVGDAIDPNKLPDFSVFAKYLSAGGGFGVPDDEGMTFTQFTLKKSNP